MNGNQALGALHLDLNLTRNEKIHLVVFSKVDIVSDKRDFKAYFYGFIFIR